ncbi:S8 family serine peptidase [Bacillus horti]|uniref:SLH domain-containing protein n=1 Tax=Caldalkalibacillus horti TaxID=77523 RepID=A0ABT9VZC7_9BACI|nr:S8 family serine peptidase [Bacillus horti]MDQ0166358.1 hypothetical protein [Bacillus horti]
MKSKLFFILRSLLLLLLIMVVLVTFLTIFSKPDVPVSEAPLLEVPTEFEEHSHWIVKWLEDFEQPSMDQMEILHIDHERRLALIRLYEDVDVLAWYMEWVHMEEIEYLEPDYTMTIDSVSLSNDPHRSLQTYLAQIEAYAGWELVRANRDITIAILDTGVDTSHPDLKENLVPGINLVDPLLPPEDDHGHGTQLAGVIGAVGNNEEGVAGLLWSTNIMPIKVLPAEGEGSPFLVSQGIYQAVDRGASVVLMSLGSPVYSKTLEDAVLYAEENGVLLVAATGNEGGRVNYPAAFPTVLAVGAVNAADAPAPYSNSGPEIHIVAPGTVYTTGLAGEYRLATGTSLSAAQVAGLAGLVLKRHPEFTPAQLRNHLLYTSEDVHEPGWDVQTGHGRINVWKALTTPPATDIYEPNNSMVQAAPFPIESMISAQLADEEDIDWFKIDSPYQGVLTLSVELSEPREEGLELIYFSNREQDQTFRYHVNHSREIRLMVDSGVSHIKLRFHEDEPHTRPISYSMTSSFTIYADQQEPNNTKEQAFPLEGNGEVLTGTFHRDNMRDWYYIDVPQKGELDIHVSVDTLRLDPVLYLERPDGTSVRVDEGNVSNGQEERLVTDVERGRYYLRLHHYYDNKVNGEYYLRTTYRPYFEDENEPNNSPVQATRLLLSQIIEATIHTRTDEDWYRVRVRDQNQYVTIRAYGIPSFVSLSIRLYDENEELITVKTQHGNEKEIHIGRRLQPGIYYIQVNARQAFPFESYRLQASQSTIIGGYRDIRRFWAQDSIVLVSQQGYFEGVGDYLFHPADPVTRAAVAQVLQRMYSFDANAEAEGDAFEDVGQEHWASEAIAQMSESNVMDGYSDGTFAPSRSITRAEVVTIFEQLILRQMNVEPTTQRTITYRDLSSNHFAYGSIMRLSRLGVITGYADYTFKPNQVMTRAEFARFVEKVVELQEENHSAL